MEKVVTLEMSLHLLNSREHQSTTVMGTEVFGCSWGGRRLNLWFLKIFWEIIFRIVQIVVKFSFPVFIFFFCDSKLSLIFVLLLLNVDRPFGASRPPLLLPEVWRGGVEETGGKEATLLTGGILNIGVSVKYEHAVLGSKNYRG